MFKNQLARLAKAALFAVISIGSMATGLSITTYTLAKANDLVSARAEAGVLAQAPRDRVCLR